MKIIFKIIAVITILIVYIIGYNNINIEKTNFTESELQMIKNSI